MTAAATEGRTAWRLRGLVAGMIVVAIALHVTVAGQHRLLALHVPWWVVVLGFTAGELIHIRLPFRSEAHDFTLTEVPLVIAPFVQSPLGALSAIVVGIALARIVVGRQALIKWAFNLAVGALDVGIVMVLMHAALKEPGDFEPSSWIAAVAASLVSTTVTAAMVATAISIVEGSSRREVLARSYRSAVVISLTNATLGVMILVTMQAEPWALTLFVIPAAVLAGSYRTMVTRSEERDRLEFLYGASQAVRGARTIDDAVERLLATSRDGFSARLVELVLYTPETDEFRYRAVLDDDGFHREREPAGAEILRAWAASLDGSVSVRPADADLPPAVRDHVHRLEADHVLAAPLMGEDTFGLLFVVDRVGDTADFGPNEVRLLGALAEQIGGMLESDELSRALQELRDLQSLLAHEANHDQLTGLANRRLFVERVGELLHATNEDGGDGATIVFVDLDEFKAVNDTMGHQTGDRVLIEIAHRIRTHVRPEDLPCRLGGDEFAVLVAAGDEQRAIALAERIHATIAEPIPLGGLDLHIGCSIGVATGATAEVTVDELLRNADVAMYTAKATGLGGVEHFVPGMPSRFSESMAIRAALRRALTVDGRGGIEVHYQPVVELGTERILSVEALARWTDPVRGEVPPEVFVTAAEGDDLITDIGTAVLRRATRDIASLLGRGTDLDLAVNVSFRELARANFVPSVVAACQASGFPLDHLILEVTESTLLDESDIVAQRLAELRALGVRIAFDDFGTGYSSLAHLRWSPADSLKIDRSFVHGVTDTGADLALVHAMIQLGRDLSLTVVAEGVETRTQADHLRNLGCEQAQGYLFGRPMPITELGDRLNQPIG